MIACVAGCPSRSRDASRPDRGIEIPPPRDPDAGVVVPQSAPWHETWAPLQYVDGPRGAFLVRKQWPDVIVQDPMTGHVLSRILLPELPLSKTGAVTNKGAVGISPDGARVCVTHKGIVGAYDRSGRQWLWREPLADRADYVLVTDRVCAVAVRDGERVRLLVRDLDSGAARDPVTGPLPDGRVDAVLWSDDGSALAAGRYRRRSARDNRPMLWRVADARALAFTRELEARCAGFDGGTFVWAPAAEMPARTAAATSRALGRPAVADTTRCRPPKLPGDAVVVAVGSMGRTVVTSDLTGDRAGLVSRVGATGERRAILSDAPRQSTGFHVISDSGWLVAANTGGALRVWDLRLGGPPATVGEGLGRVRGPPVFGHGDAWVGVVTARGVLRRWTPAGEELPSVALPDRRGFTARSFFRVFSGPDERLAVRRVDIHGRGKLRYQPRVLHIGTTSGPLRRAKVPASPVSHRADAVATAYEALAMADVEEAAWTRIDGTTYLVLVDHQDGVRVVDADARKVVGHYKGVLWPGPGHRGLSISPEGTRAALALDGLVRGRGRQQGVVIVGVPHARLESFIPVDYLAKLVEDTRWVDDRRLALAWDATRHFGGDLFARVGVSSGGRQPESIYVASGQGRVQLAHAARALHQNLESGAVRVYRLDGSEVVTLALFADGHVAHAPDGRWTCAGSGCEVLRCSVEGESHAVTHAACRKRRVDGFELREELERPAARPGWEVDLSAVE